MQDRRERRIGMRLRLAIAEAGAHRAGIGAGGPVQLRHRTGKTRLRRVAERAGLVAVHRELLVVQHQLAESLDLLDLIVWGLGQTFDRARLDAVDLGLDLRDLLQHAGRERRAAVLRAGRIRDHGERDHRRCKRQNRARCRARGWINKRHAWPLCGNRFGTRRARGILISILATNALEKELCDLAVWTMSKWQYLPSKTIFRQPPRKFQPKTN